MAVIKPCFCILLIFKKLLDLAFMIRDILFSILLYTIQIDLAYVFYGKPNFDFKKIICEQKQIIR